MYAIRSYYAGTTPLTPAQDGDSIQQMAARNGNSGDWKSIAAANGLDDPFRLQAGALLDMNAGVSAGISGGISAGASVGLSAGASAGASLSGGFGAAAGLSAGGQVGFSAGLGGGAVFSAGAGASA